MIREYMIQEKLGIGSYGTVYKVIKKGTNDLYVIKQISLFGLTEEEIKDVKLEAQILSSINSPYVVRYYDSFEEKNFLNIIMEYCNGGDLAKFIEEKQSKNEKLKEDLIWNLFIKMILGLAAIHKLKILHRDLKTLNIFLTKDLDIKIGDLGVAKILSHSRSFAKTLIGTPYYLSPELCEEKPYNYKSDIWALGCILYELCTFEHPFNAKSQGGLILKILESEPKPIGNYYSKDLQKLIDKILKKKMEERPFCQDILKNNKVIEKAKEFQLYNIITELYPELKEKNDDTPNFKINVNVNNKDKLIYNKYRPKNYKIKNSLQKNNSIGNIDIKSNNNRNNNILYKKNNKVKYKSQFNSISTDSRSHNSIKNIFVRNNEKEPKDNSRNKNNINGGNIFNKKNYNNINNSDYNNINKPFIKKPLNQFPLSSKNQNNKQNDNVRYTNIEQYNNFINKKDKKEIKSIKSINTSSKSAKKLFINLNNNNNKINIIKNGICLRSNKSAGKKFFVIQNINKDIKTHNNEMNNNKYINYEKNTDNIVNINKNLNNNYFNNNIDIKHIKTNIINNNKIKIDKNYEKHKNIDINVNESIEKFENKLKKFYQYSPDIQSKKISYINNNKNDMQTPNKDNLINEDKLLKLDPIDIFDNNNHKDFMDLMGEQYNNNGKANIMEFVKNLNEYKPKYKINNQIQNNYKRNRSKSKSVCENDNYMNFNNIQNQIYKNKIIQG